METVKKRIEQDRTKLETAQADIKKWVDDFKAASNEKIAEWKDKRERPSGCQCGHCGRRSSPLAPAPVRTPGGGFVLSDRPQPCS